MRILHLASFTGNIGDNASHMGFRNILDQVIGNDYEIEELEIRKFYQNYNLPGKQRFDERFVSTANNFDMLFIGGGGFLDYWVEGSQTGTTLDISVEILNKIKVPIIIGSVGSFPHKPIPEGNIVKFRHFLKYVKSRDNMHILLRNDGSKTHLIEVFGKELIDDLPEIIDHAFFFDPPQQPVSITDKEYLLINTTLDQLGMQSSTNNLTVEEYHEEIRSVLKYILEQTEYDIVFAPHIYKDISAIIKLLNGINDFYLRSRIKIAPYCQGNVGANYIFNLYRNSKMNVGMRFHANVCSLAFNKPTIGLAALPRVEQIHHYIGSTNFVYINKLLDDSIEKLIGNSEINSTVKVNINKYKDITKDKYAQVLNLYN